MTVTTNHDIRYEYTTQLFSSILTNAQSAYFWVEEMVFLEYLIDASMPQSLSIINFSLICFMSAIYEVFLG